MVNFKRTMVISQSKEDKELFLWTPYIGNKMVKGSFPSDDFSDLVMYLISFFGMESSMKDIYERLSVYIDEETIPE